MNETVAEPVCLDDDSLRSIRDALRGLRFGSVTVIVQDGVIVQVERIEKKRLPRKPVRDIIA
jgi:hypothetical protein